MHQAARRRRRRRRRENIIYSTIHQRRHCRPLGWRLICEYIHTDCSSDAASQAALPADRAQESLHAAQPPPSKCHLNSLFSENLAPLHATKKKKKKKKLFSLGFERASFFFFFSSLPTTSRSHFHLFPSLRYAVGQDESKCLNSSVRVRSTNYVKTADVKQKCLFKARNQRKTRDYRRPVML